MQSATDTTDRTLALLDRYSDALPGQSFYLQVLYVDPHWPYAPPAGALAAVGGGTRPVDQYDGEIRYADDEIGRLLDGMSDRGLLDDTLIVVTSDHGEGLDSHPGVPLSSAHGYTLYESVLRVPLVMWHPSLPAGTDVTALVSSLDVLPTVLDVVGLPGDGLPGRSLARLARGGAEDPVPAFAETDWRYTRKLAVVTDAWHLVSNPDAAAYRADGTHEQATLSGPEKRSLTLVPDVELYPRGSQPQVPDRAVDDPTARDTLLGLLDAFDAGVPIRPPENRDPKDTLVRGDGTVEVHGGSVPTMDAGLGDQLRSLGYLGDD